MKICFTVFQTEYRQTLASAHRAALRTLQSFVSHAPLFYSTIGQLPSAYKELGSLIQQLTQLSINIKPGTSSQYTQKVIEVLKCFVFFHRNENGILHSIVFYREALCDIQKIIEICMQLILLIQLVKFINMFNVIYSICVKIVDVFFTISF